METIYRTLKLPDLIKAVLEVSWHHQRACSRRLGLLPYPFRPAATFLPRILLCGMQLLLEASAGDFEKPDLFFAEVLILAQSDDGVD